MEPGVPERADPRAAGALDELARLIAGAPLNLVSRSERDRIREWHVEEALRVGAALPLRTGSRWLDLGTGGGLPGLALAIAHPEVTWVLLDSVRKKSQAVREFARALRLLNVDVECSRAETAARAARYRGGFDGVVARAVAPLVELVELARGFVPDGGYLAAIKGPAWKGEVADAAWACGELGWGDVHARRVTSTVRPTWLVTMRAMGAPPEQYPRGVGIPGRRPLLGSGSRP